VFFCHYVNHFLADIFLSTDERTKDDDRAIDVYSIAVMRQKR